MGLKADQSRDDLAQWDIGRCTDVECWTDWLADIDFGMWPDLRRRESGSHQICRLKYILWAREIQGRLIKA